MIVILGSASPRRRELLSSLITSFRIEIADIDEVEIPGEDPLIHCRRLSQEKGEAIQKRLSPDTEDTLIITSDTIVALEDKILGKPENRQHAFNTLKFLNGKTHRVITAISLSILRRGGAWKTATESESTSVTFKHLSDREINSYLDSIHYMDKAGAYAIQENGGMIIESVKGSESNVIGFPVGLFKAMLSKLDLSHILDRDN